MKNISRFYLFALLSTALIFTHCGKDPAPTPDITVSTSNFSASIAENPAAGTVLGSVTGTTSSGSVTFSLQTESVVGAFNINSTSGELTVADATLYDFETNPSITGTVQVANGSVTQTADITVSLTDVDEMVMTTVTTEDFSISIPENPAQGMILGNVSGSSNNGAVTFTLLTESFPGALSIGSSDGVLTVLDEFVFDFEVNPSITATVEVANGDVKKIANVTITITDVDETPPATIWAGAIMTFTKAADADPMDVANQDMLTMNVILGRLNDGGQLINFATETDDNKTTSPAGTEWAAGTTADIDALTFGTLRDLGKPKDVLVGNNFVLKLVEDNILVDIKFLSWGDQMNGAFSYERSTPN